LSSCGSWLQVLDAQAPIQQPPKGRRRPRNGARRPCYRGERPKRDRSTPTRRRRDRSV